MQSALATDFAARSIPVPSWVPMHVATMLAGRPVVVEIPKAVKTRLRSPQKIRVSEWAEKYRIVAEGAHVGPWRHELAPHTVKIMDTYGMPWVREVWFCGVEQSGKTNTMINCLGWAIDCDPGNAFYLMPTEDTSDKVVGGKLKPTLQRSPRLARYLSRKQDEATLARINLTHGMTIYPAHANSVSSMATWAAKHCLGDEVDKYPAMAGKEADPITLLKKRNRNYRGRYKRFFSSTPAGMYIYKGMKACHQVWEFRVRCSECGQLIRMDAEHLLIPEGATHENVDQLGAGYECNACECHWTDQDREAAIKAGAWVCVKGAEIARPAKVGFHHRSWECLDIPLHEIAAAWLKSQTGDHAAKVAWANGYEAVDYEVEKKERKEDFILLLRDDRPAGQVPTWADLLEISIDTQARGFWYRIRAWRFGLEMESALIQCGFVDSFAALDLLIYGRSGEGFEHLSHRASYLDAEGRQYHIESGIIDSAGHRTSEVYAWTRRPGSLVIPAKGASGRKTQPVSVSKIDMWPGTNKPIPGGLRLYHIDTHFHKDALAGKLAITPGDPGSFWLHSGYTAGQLQDLERDPSLKLPNSLEDYAKQMCVEYSNDKGLWECPEGKDNHLWDCESNGYALALYIGVPYRTSDKEESPPPPPQNQQPTSTTGRSMPSWFQSRR